MGSQSAQFDYDEKPWMISQTVAAWISVLGVAFALVPLLQERIVRIKNRNAGRMSSDPEKMSFFYVTPPSNLKALFGECTKEPRLTTIRGLIHAGDQYLWTSAALDHVKISRGEICWVPLYRSVFNTVAANRFNGSDNVSEVKAFLERAWNHLNDEKIKHSVDRNAWIDFKHRVTDAIREPVKDGHTVILENYQHDVNELIETSVPPLRSQLYKPGSGMESLILPSKARPWILEFLSSWFRRFSMFTRSSFSKKEDVPVFPIDSSMDDEISLLQFNPNPKLVCCTRKLRPPERVTFNPIPASPASLFQRQKEAPIQRIKYSRTISQDTVPSIASSTSPKDYLSTLGRQFHKAFTYKEGAGANISFEGIVRPDSNQYDEVTIRRNESGLNDTRACWILDGKPCIELCREELAALALALGMKLRVNDFTSIVSGFGAFSTSLGIQRSGGYWKAHLVHGSRIPSQKNSQGSGYTILMAKHIACGCLPFTDTGVFVRTVYVTKNVLRALTRGHHIMDCTDYGGPSLEYLRRLPSAKQIDALYGMSKKPADLKAAKKYQRERYLRRIGSFVPNSSFPFPVSNPVVKSLETIHSDKTFDRSEGPSTPDLPRTPRNSTTVRPVAQSTFLALGALLNADGNPIGSNCTWQRAVAGIAFGGLVPQAATYLTEAVRFTVAGKLGCCITALESLINELHRFDQDSEVFGPYVARRVTARYGVDNVDYSMPSRITTQEAGATFGRYMNLLECITARCNSAPNPPMETVFEASCELIEECYLAAVTKEGDRYADDLGMQIQSITQQLEKHAPMEPKDCAIIVRCIIAAWAEQVPLIDLEERCSKANPELSPNRMATLEDLPAVCALG